MISSGANTTGRGGTATIAGLERNVRSTIEFERIQVSGASLSFPVNALTGMFVGSDNPLYYLYTTFRGEVAYFKDVPTNLDYAHLDGTTAFDRFLGGALGSNGGAFAPGGALANQVTKRKVGYAKRDWFLFVDRLRSQPMDSLDQSGQLCCLHGATFYTRKNSQKTNFNDPDAPFGVFNDRDGVAGRNRSLQKPVTNAAVAASVRAGHGEPEGMCIVEGPESGLVDDVQREHAIHGRELAPEFHLLLRLAWENGYPASGGLEVLGPVCGERALQRH